MQGFQATLFPILALEQHHEIITADMAAEIDQRVDDFGQCLRQQSDDVIAATIAEDVVEGLEVVNVEIAGVETDLAFEKTFDGARFTEITSALAPSSVDLTLPRFKIESKSDLATELAVMGMPLAFDAARADFSGITAEERLFISKVIHQANISVDEKGTEGAAATAVVMLAGSAPVAKAATVHVDRPFIFAVRDTATGAILFLGRVVDPGA